jgi:acetyl esterase/lipase
MSRSLARVTATVLLAVGAAFAAQATPAFASLSSLLAPPAPPVKFIPAVQAPVSADPVGAPVGTMLIVHGGGWTGHDGDVQRHLLTARGDLFLARGWRVVSVDYDEGPQGIQDVMDVAGAELARGTSNGPLCIYGESSGGHIALMVAARMRSIDCVIGVGTPTDLKLYADEEAGNANPKVGLVTSQISRLFGTTADALAPFDLVTLAPQIRADILLVREADDVLVNADQAQRFIDARPTTQFLELEPGDPSNPQAAFVHGTTTDAGRVLYASTAGSFVDRAVENHRAEDAAREAGCAKVTRTVRDAGEGVLQGALRCLARKQAGSLPSNLGGWHQTSLRLRGDVNAARLWAQLQDSRAGRLALAATARARTRVSAQIGDRTRVLVQALGR